MIITILRYKYKHFSYSFDIQSLHLYFVNYYELCDEYYVSDVLYDGATVTTTPPSSTTEADRYSQTSYLNQWALKYALKCTTIYM